MSNNNDMLQTIAGVLGTVLEWYDFAIYGYFSDTIAQVFFPLANNSHDSYRNLILSYIVFGSAFVMRPIGGIVTGHIGDKLGRKRALVFALFSMILPTVGMGFLPTYEQVGGWSTALLVICRMLQGFSAGGQLPSSLVYTLENKPKEHWGYYGSFVNMAANFGCMLGNLMVAIIRQVLNDDQLLRWGWRAAFISGISVLPVAIYVRLYGKEHNPNEAVYNDDDGTTKSGESEEHDSNEQQAGVGIYGRASPAASSSLQLQQKHPLREATKRENLPSLLSASLVPMLYGGGYYISVVWMAIFMEKLIDPPVNGAFWVNLVNNIFGLLGVSFLAGWLSDYVGRVRTMVFGAITASIAGPFMVYIISQGNTVNALFAQFALCCFVSLYSGPSLTWLVETFPPHVRLTSVALGFNVGMCISSGFAPAVATAMVTVFPSAPGFLYTIFGVLGLIGMSIPRKVHQGGGVDDETLWKENTEVNFIDAIEDDLSEHLL
eukprot:CAMPEP_0201671906 /NCGR_PEP_ID=MMETSP0494-20130426/31038_1 /ASSEMBLY_ACC=CAM_ASM_000839 /TAXON_ID=420259 /ORGANISM="Thalassiosira gravida, Strain GMp14c1" /LENGTH=489 /DNA_ID=CAMNT_0048153407 /DNA_START=173 /DNA_END=1642 /DNA_ORIENTATION=-